MALKRPEQATKDARMGLCMCRNKGIIGNFWHNLWQEKKGEI